MTFHLYVYVLLHVNSSHQVLLLLLYPELVFTCIFISLYILVPSVSLRECSSNWDLCYTVSHSPAFPTVVPQLASTIEAWCYTRHTIGSYPRDCVPVDQMKGCATFYKFTAVIYYSQVECSALRSITLVL
jgi:hypothetical protein